jgi:hypothetical protein
MGPSVTRRRPYGLLSLLIVTSTVIGTLGVAPATATVKTGAPRITVPAPPGPAATPGAKLWAARNWSGYALPVSGTPATKYTSVTGSWTVPSVNAPPHPGKAKQYSATWVGIDGDNDGNDLIQAGTEQDWARGSASYYAWWEILPAAETPIASITVQPGDSMTVSIVQGSPDWTITLTDETTGKSFTTEKSYSGLHETAEWIQEAPTVGGRVAALAHDSTVVFQDLTANGANPALVESDGIEMVKARKVISIPSAPNAEQNGFAVAFGKVAPPPPS